MHTPYPRIPSDALMDQDRDAVWAYYQTRSAQLAIDGFRWDGLLQEMHGCLWTRFEREGHFFCSIYVPTPLHGQGLLKKVQQLINLPVVTVSACHIVGALHAMNIPFELAGEPILSSLEYRLMEDFYGDRRAERSGVLLARHIDEGLAVMRAWGASDLALRAFCLHPLIQSDTDLATEFHRLAAQLQTPDGTTTLALAMEYRSVANNYLSHHSLPPTGIRLSPLKEVNDMLVGDKIQNKKDFLLYHYPSHARSERLNAYFNEWISALGAQEQEAPLRELISLP